MAYHVTRRCPHCGDAYQINRRSGEWDYGCPIQICTRCKKSFIDTNVKEPALYGYENMHEDIQKGETGCVYFLFTPFAIIGFLVGLYFIGSSLFDKDFKGVLTGCAVCAFTGFICYAIIRSIQMEQEKAKNKPEIKTRQRHEYDRSYERLQNMEYLKMLAQYDSKAKKLLASKERGEKEEYAARP